MVNELWMNLWRVMNYVILRVNFSTTVFKVLKYMSSTSGILRAKLDCQNKSLHKMWSEPTLQSHKELLFIITV